MWLCHNSAPDKGQPVNYVVKNMNETFQLFLSLSSFFGFWRNRKCVAQAAIVYLSIQTFASLLWDLKQSVSCHSRRVPNMARQCPVTHCTGHPISTTYSHTLPDFVNIAISQGLFSQKTQGRQIGRNVVKKKCVAALGTIVKAHYCEW